MKIIYLNICFFGPYNGENFKKKTEVVFYSFILIFGKTFLESWGLINFFQRSQKFKFLSFFNFIVRSIFIFYFEGSERF